MQLILFGFVSPRLHLELSNRMSTANPKSRFASAPKPWAAFTNSYATTLLTFRVRCSIDFSFISLPSSRRIFSTIFSLKIRMMTANIRTPIYLLSSPTIQPISLKTSKMMFVQFQFNVPGNGTDIEAVYKGEGQIHTNRGLPESLVEIQEATSASQVSKPDPELRIGPHAKEPQEHPPLSRCSDTKSSNSR